MQLTRTIVTAILGIVFLCSSIGTVTILHACNGVVVATASCCCEQERSEKDTASEHSDTTSKESGCCSTDISLAPSTIEYTAPSVSAVTIVPVALIDWQLSLLPENTGYSSYYDYQTFLVPDKRLAPSLPTLCVFLI